MVIQYPHVLTVTVSGVATKNVNGDWIKQPATTSAGMPCRAEPQNGNGLIKGADGNEVNFSWIIYLPLSTINIPQGATVEVYEGGLLKCKEVVQRFSRGQLNARVWA